MKDSIGFVGQLVVASWWHRMWTARWQAVGAVVRVVGSRGPTFGPIVVRRHRGVVQLARSHRKVSFGFEILRQRQPIVANSLLTEMVLKIPDASRVGSSARHEGVAAWGTKGVLYERSFKCESRFGQVVEMWRVRKGEVVGANVDAHVVNYYEQDVLGGFFGGCGLRKGLESEKHGADV